jgi:hypothetical protein
VAIGFVTMNINTHYFLTREIAAIGITADSLYVAIIMLKNIPESGKIVKYAESLLKQKCMFGTEQTNTILKSWKIPQNINQQNAQDAVLISH